jgi:hypothetical protein
MTGADSLNVGADMRPPLGQASELCCAAHAFVRVSSSPWPGAVTGLCSHSGRIVGRGSSVQLRLRTLEQVRTGGWTHKCGSRMCGVHGVTKAHPCSYASAHKTKYVTLDVQLRPGGERSPLGD